MNYFLKALSHRPTDRLYPCSHTHTMLQLMLQENRLNAGRLEASDFIDSSILQVVNSIISYFYFNFVLLPSQNYYHFHEDSHSPFDRQ